MATTSDAYGYFARDWYDRETRNCDDGSLRGVKAKIWELDRVYRKRMAHIEAVSDKQINKLHNRIDKLGVLVKKLTAAAEKG